MATLKQIIEAQAAAADANTSISDLYSIINAAFKEGNPSATYDSTGAMPISAAFVGTILSDVDGVLYCLDSAGGSWNAIGM